MIKSVITKLNKYEGLVLILALLAILRIPSLFEPAWYGDENIYLTIGQGVRKGLFLYKDITDFPNKPPLIYLLAAVVQNVFWFRMVLLFWNGVHAVVMFFLAKSMFPKIKWVWYAVTVLFVLLTSLPVWEGNIANGEIFMSMLVTAGVLVLWKARLKKKNVLKKYFLAGILIALGFLFKIPVGAEIAALMLFFFVFLRKTNLRAIFSIVADPHLYIFLLGLGLPIIITLGFHALQGVSPVDLIRSATGSTGYVSVWEQQTGIRAYLSFGSLPARAALVGIITLVLYVARNKLSKELVLASVWLVFALFGALLSARPYSHYLLQGVPALTILVGVVLASWKKRGNIVVAAAVFGIAIAAYVRFGFSTYPVTSYYKNFAEFVTGKISETEYYNRFDGRMERNYAVAKYLKTRTLPDEHIFIWGTEPGIYVLADRLPVGRLTTSFHVEDLDEYARLGEELAEVTPKYIVVMENETRDFPQLERLIDSQYTLVEKIGEAQIYYLMPQT